MTASMRAGPILAVAVLGMMLAGCNTQTVRSTVHDPVATELAGAPETELLDVGVNVFDPGLDGLRDDEPVTSPAVRRAEARYMPQQLTETLQHSGNWGAVRIIPDRQSETDVWVDGRILESDGETLKLQVTVQDATGRTWFTRTYEERASKYAYDNQVRAGTEPFQGLYNRVANDMLEYRRGLEAAGVAAIRTTAALRFAQRFAPQIDDEYLEADGRGNYRIKRLPAAGDPVLEQVRRIRERDYMFVDTMQDYYTSFARQMHDPYRQWRAEAYREAEALRQLKSQATARAIGGALAILGGVLAQGTDSRTARTAGVLGIGAGAYMLKSAMDKNSEAQIHSAALRELSASLDAEIAPHSLALEDRTVTLTGTVDEQYRQWRAILRELHEAETGQSLQTVTGH